MGAISDINQYNWGLHLILSRGLAAWLSTVTAMFTDTISLSTTETPLSPELPDSACEPIVLCLSQIVLNHVREAMA